jgi:hypothetical protein
LELYSDEVLFPLAFLGQAEKIESLIIEGGLYFDLLITTAGEDVVDDIYHYANASFAVAIGTRVISLKTSSLLERGSAFSAFGASVCTIDVGENG